MSRSAGPSRRSSDGRRYIARKTVTLSGKRQFHSSARADVYRRRRTLLVAVARSFDVNVSVLSGSGRLLVSMQIELAARLPGLFIDGGLKTMVLAPELVIQTDTSMRPD